MQKSRRANSEGQATFNKLMNEAGKFDTNMPNLIKRFMVK
jgi:hypothetical protein